MPRLLRQLKHLFIPRTTNNFRARLLHNSSIFLIIGFIIGANVLTRLIDSTPFYILGFNSSVTIDEVVSATNRERIAYGLPPLVYSDTLADAARRKALNMLEENYWAHNSPSGKNPWIWFQQVGYNYLYAGENLAKDFGSTDRMIAAWMSSPTHKANIVNSKYKEIGVAVVPGTLVGSETVLVVQLFGTPAETMGSVSEANALSQEPIIAQIKGSTIEVEEDSRPFILDKYLVKKWTGVSVAILFLLALVFDLIVSENNKLSRRVGKNWGHIVVINVMLLLVSIAHAGSIK